jgi:hypothetical protein
MEEIKKLKEKFKHQAYNIGYGTNNVKFVGLLYYLTLGSFFLRNKGGNPYNKLFFISTFILGIPASFYFSKYVLGSSEYRAIYNSMKHDEESEKYLETKISEK